MSTHVRPFSNLVMQADLVRAFHIRRAIGAREVIGIELRLQQQKRGDAAHDGRRVAGFAGRQIAA